MEEMEKKRQKFEQWLNSLSDKTFGKVYDFMISMSNGLEPETGGSDNRWEIFTPTSAD